MRAPRALINDPYEDGTYRAGKGAGMNYGNDWGYIDVFFGTLGPGMSMIVGLMGSA